eukprot:c15951_g1_i1.p1 GENE.c15951_g1_i1~~c15951_g1_i1.p1  ORF type:complete len:293 (+),score=43.01 c15951_g1_i1:1339-2217(+)
MVVKFGRLTDWSKDAAVAEFNTLVKLRRHPNVGVLYGLQRHTLADDSCVHCLFFEMLGPNLTVVRSTRKLKTLCAGPLAVAVAHQVALALDFLHQRQTVHRDVKPDNICLARPYTFEELDAGVMPVVKLIDYDSARALALDMSTDAGTKFYRAPEMASSQYGLEVDWFGLGMSVVFLVEGYGTVVDEAKAIQHGLALPARSQALSCPAGYLDAVRALTLSDSTQRWGYKQLKQSLFMQTAVEKWPVAHQDAESAAKVACLAARWAVATATGLAADSDPDSAVAAPVGAPASG